MTPEQITEKLEFIGNLMDELRIEITTFRISLDKLDTQVAADISYDMGLREMEGDFRKRLVRLDEAMAAHLPEHFDRLRSGTP